MYTGVELGYYILNRSLDRGESITNMKLQYMVYYTELFYLSRHGERILGDDYELRRTGPIQVELYDELKIYFDYSLPYMQEYLQYYVDLETLEVRERVKSIEDLSFNRYVDHIINKVLDSYSEVESGWDILESFRKEIEGLTFKGKGFIGERGMLEHAYALGLGI